MSLDTGINAMPYDAFRDLLSHCISILELGISRSESRFIIRLMRHFKTLRSFLNNHPSTSVRILKAHLKGYAFSSNPCVVAELAYNSLKVASPPILATSAQGDSLSDENLHDEFTSPSFEIQFVPHDSQLAETKVMLATLALIYLLDSKEYELAMELADKLANLMLSFNKRIMDYLAAKIYFYYSRSYELGGKFKDARNLLMKSYRKACLHHDPMTQAVTFNCILRNLIHHKLYSQAFKLICKTTFPEYLSSNAQYARYLYYYGKVLSVQLEYSEACSKLMQAIRKAPQNDKTAYGFKLQATKLSIIVNLLMCDIPSKSVFTNPSTRKDLKPYEAVVIAVRTGDLGIFSELCNKYSSLFEKDDTMFLISRLRNNVIKGGLRKINIAYSKIPLSHVASKLGISSVDYTESIISKAIHDGIIEAVIDHDAQFVQSKCNVDLYKSYEPMRAFHKRINFCLKLHSNAIQAMRYPEEQENSKDAAVPSNDKDSLELEFDNGLGDGPLL
ncbi:proteasome regulatory component, putative [Theileria equi strain WA]|uniref:Proteasome regulatory component, putative n=1 Tax=Theileria equi strain WA TaxID=1537102 RepID=L0B0X6_THEEQ|nr:proteasome regulatory component, putative [Theileria equi strain WA]AFZ81465.1 proteasome regulatory component, putative [Theileria equi strain WA]|eukprot:XP_004831131.1 proteasome regulatory component, putative [Theileria equi strain WA]